MENVNNSVVILGYKERVGLLNPDVSILKNGILIGTVERRGRCQLDIKEACELTFKIDNPVAQLQLIGRPTTCRVNPGDQILLSYNTFTGKLVAQLTDNNNLQQTIERNTKKEKKGRIVGIVVAIILAAVYFGIVQPLSLSPTSSYKEEVRALGFPTNEIDHWIDNAMDQYNCSLVKVTSVKANGKWCLKLYVDVLYYHDFRSKGEPHKGIVNLCFEPSNGRIYDGDFEVLN